MARVPPFQFSHPLQKLPRPGFAAVTAEPPYQIPGLGWQVLRIKVAAFAAHLLELIQRVVPQVFAVLLEHDLRATCNGRPGAANQGS